jgi:undecaprenyl-diphosphatase
VIAAAGLLKLGDLTGRLGAGIHGQILLGSVLSGVDAYLSVRFLARYFATRSLRPFGWYCAVADAFRLAWFACADCRPPHSPSRRRPIPAPKPHRGS